MIRIRSSLHVLVAAVLALAWVTGANAAEPRPWDQKAVAALAQQLAEAVSAMRAELRQTPPDNIASGQARARQRFGQRLRVIEQQTAALNRALQGGQGRDETLAIFQRIDRERVDAAEEARRMFLSQSILETIEGARDELDALREYYTGGSAPTPRSVGGSTESSGGESGQQDR